MYIVYYVSHSIGFLAYYFVMFMKYKENLKIPNG